MDAGVPPDRRRQVQNLTETHMDKDEFDDGSMFSSNKILIGIAVVALLAVLIGMGGQREAQDKRADVYASQDEAADRADRTAGFKEKEEEKSK